MDIQEAFDKSLRETIDMRAAYKSKVDSLRSSIRAAAELGLSQHRIADKSKRVASGEMAAYVDASVDMVLKMAREHVAGLVSQKTGVNCPSDKVPDVALAPFIELYQEKAISGVKAALLWQA